MISYNRLYFEKDGRPWYPVMGEYQYARSDCRYWADGLAKMKAAGVDVVSSYAFWIYHEEIKGRYNFRGNNNLRRFVREIKDAGMFFCLRIGPWVHAEARNGGFPDWIYGQPYKLRSNDPGYMADVEAYFKELYKQCEGYMYKDGGPIFAVQVENEYSQWGAQGPDIGDKHIDALIELLKKIGFDVPVYMATGWGEAATGGAIPVWGSYCEAPWERDDKELPPMDGYLFSLNPNDANIGSDTGRKEMDADVSKSRYPYATVELGAGIQVTKVRRPIVRGEDNGALAVCRIGSGASVLGYYVFHGGMHPTGALSGMQEYRREGALEAGFCCDLPETDYDFQAAIGQYGRMHEGAFELKLWNYFIKNFGETLCTMPAYLGEDNAAVPDDFARLRYAVRRKGESGFVFFNNFVRHYDLAERRLENFTVETESGRAVFPDFTLKNGQYCIFPFNMPIGRAVLKTATATPLCVLNGKDYVFWTETGEAEYDVDGVFDGKLITLSKRDALRCFKFTCDGEERIFLTNGELFETERGIELCCTEEPYLKIYPRPQRAPEGFAETFPDGIFSVYRKGGERKRAEAKFRLIKSCDEYADYEIDVLYGGETENVFLSMDYGGDRAELYIDGERVTDHFYTGRPFEAGLKNYGFPKRLHLKVYPMRADDFVYVEKKPAFEGGRAMYLERVTAETEVRSVVYRR